MKLLMNPEFLRRLALVLGLFFSIMMFMNTRPYLYEAGYLDFTAQYKSLYTSKETLKKAKKYIIDYKAKQHPDKDYSPALLSIDRKLKAIESKLQKPVEEYIAQKTRGMTTKVSGPEWEKLLSQMKKHYRGQPLANFELNRAVEDDNKNLYFPLGTEPFASVLGKYNKAFLVHEHNGDTNYFLLAMFSPIDRMDDDAQEELLHPWRSYSWIPFVLGLVLYLFIIPKVKCPKDAYGYPQLGGVMVSDFFGLLFGGVFFFFGAMVAVSFRANPVTPFALAPGPLTGLLILWALGLLIVIGGMSYGVRWRNYWIRLLPKGLEVHTFNGSRFFAYEHMKLAELYQRDYGWMIKLATLLSFLNPSPGSAAMIAANSRNTTDQRLVIKMDNDERCTIKLQHFKEDLYDTTVSVARALQDNGVQLDDALAVLRSK